jgi:hypothetical protein
MTFPTSRQRHTARLPKVRGSTALGRAQAVDWVLAERLYRQGDISIREIARRVGVSEGAVRKRANGKGWSRQSADVVRNSVREDELDLSEAPQWMRDYFEGK